MRVLALVHQWIPRHCAGAELMLHSMLRALAARGHEVIVSLSRQDGTPYELDGVEVQPKVGKQDAFRWLPDADVIVTHLENTPRAAVLGRLNGVPVVQVLHNTMRITKEWLMREPPALAVCNSRWMLADYQAAVAAAGHTMPRTLVVRPPVDAAEYATTPGDRVTLVNLRRLDRDSSGFVMGKGSEVFWALAERMPKTRFLGVVGGYGNQDIRDLPNVEILPHLPHDHMRDKVYSRTRVLLMPSSYESWGRAGVEAMCSGIPVVAHPTPGLQEALGDAGIFVDREDIDGWCRALKTLALPNAHKAAAAKAKARAAELDPTDDLIAWCEAVESLPRRWR